MLIFKKILILLQLTLHLNISFDFAINVMTKYLNIPLGNPTKRFCKGKGICHWKCNIHIRF